MKHFEISGEGNKDRWVTSDKVPVLVSRYAVYHASLSTSGQIRTTMVVSIVTNWKTKTETETETENGRIRDADASIRICFDIKVIDSSGPQRMF